MRLFFWIRELLPLHRLVYGSEEQRGNREVRYIFQQEPFASISISRFLFFMIIEIVNLPFRRHFVFPGCFAYYCRCKDSFPNLGFWRIYIVLPIVCFCFASLHFWGCTLLKSGVSIVSICTRKWHHEDRLQVVTPLNHRGRHCFSLNASSSHVASAHLSIDLSFFPLIFLFLASNAPLLGWVLFGEVMSLILSRAGLCKKWWMGGTR